MTEQPEEPGAELGDWLHNEAARLDQSASAIGPEEVLARPAPDLPRSRFRRRGLALPPIPGTERRMPALAAAVVAAVLIGSLVGFGIGRASAPSSKTQTAATGGNGDQATTAVAPGAPETRSGTAMGVAPDGVYGPKLTFLGSRTTADGVTIRAYTAEYPQVQPAEPAMPESTVVESESCDASGACSGGGSSGGGTVTPPWAPPDSCNPTGELWLESSTDEAVGQTSAPGYALSDQLGATTWSVFGQSEGLPFSVAGARVGDQVATLRATWPDGFVDTAEVVNGWAYVGHKSAAAPTLEALAADGSVVESASVNEGYQLPPECMPPPPSLPPAGEEQPDDVEGAKAAVRDAITKAYQGAGIEIGDIVFTSASSAAAEVTYTEKGAFTDIVYVSLVDGVWQLGGVPCDAGPNVVCAESVPAEPPVTTTPN